MNRAITFDGGQGALDDLWVIVEPEVGAANNAGQGVGETALRLQLNLAVAQRFAPDSQHLGAIGQVEMRRRLIDDESRIPVFLA